MRNIFLIFVAAGLVFIGCASDTAHNLSKPTAHNFPKPTAEEIIGRQRIVEEKDLLFKQTCIEKGGTLDNKHEMIGLFYCQIGQHKVQNNSEGYLALIYDKNGYDKNGFNIDSLHKDTLTQYDTKGYDKNGFNQNGYDKFGFNQKGKNKNGFLLKDYFKELCVDSGGTVGWNLKVDIPTCNIDKKIIDGNNKGFKILLTYSSIYDNNGYDKNGYDLYGFNINGLNKNTLTKYNKDGYDRDGFSKDGFNRAGQDKDGYYRDGFNDKGINKDTLTQYDKNGKNRDGLTKQEQMQKDYYDKMLAIEKEKLEIQKAAQQQAQIGQERLIQAQQAQSASRKNNSYKQTVKCKRFGDIGFDAKIYEFDSSICPFGYTEF